MSSATDAAAIARLSEMGSGNLEIALIYGVVYPLAPSSSRVAKWLGHFRFLSVPRAVSANLPRVVSRLVAAGVLAGDDRGSGYCATRAHSTAMIREAHRAGLLEPLLQALSRDGFVNDWNQMRSAGIMFLRCAALSQQWRWLDPIRVRIAWPALLDPDLVEQIPRLPELFRQEAIRACAESLLEDLRPADAFLRICESIGTLHPAAVADVALVRLLQGRFDELERWLAAMPDADPLVATAIRGAVHTLRGQDSEAEAAIRAALELARAGTRKRILFPRLTVFTLALLSLSRLSNPASHALLDELIGSADKLDIVDPLLGAVRAAAELRTPPLPPISLGPRRLDDLQQLLLGLIACWSDSATLEANRKFMAAFPALRTKAEAAGFAWIVAEIDQILAVLGESAPSDLHDRLGSVSLLSAVPRVALWEHGLNSLELLANQLRRRKAPGDPATPATRRLAWVVTPRGHSNLSVETREQTLQKQGWGKGKPISLRRLKEAAGTIEWLSDQDRAVAEAIEYDPFGWGGHREYSLPARGIFLLAGHPAVQDADFQPLEVVAAEPELVINDRDADAISAELFPYPLHDDDYQTQYERGDRRLTVLHLNESVRKLRAIIPRDGLLLPGSARARLLEAVSDLAGAVRVHGGLSGTTANARFVEPDSLPWVQLTPLGDGLAVRVLVQPLPGSGIQFDPGSGGELVLAHIDDEPLQTRRSLDAERRAALALAEQAPALAAATLNTWRCELTEPEDCLELLDRLQQADARCLWPEGERLRIVSRAGGGAMKLVIKSGREWFSASGELQIDDERAIGLMQLMTLLGERPRSRFIPLGEGQFVALSDAFRNQLGLLQGLSQASGKSLRVHPLAAPALDELLGDVTVDADLAWQQRVERMRSASAFTPRIPDTLQADLRPYQQDGIVWLARLAHWGVGACLADDMGLGKTLQSLGLLLIRAPEGPALIVVPTSLVDNWQVEARRFAPTLTLRVYAGSAADRQQMLADLGPFDVLVCTYGLLQNDIKAFAARHFHTVVLDEAQAIRNATTKRAQAVRALDGGFRMAITGTPVQNNLMDLHSLMNFLNPGLLGSATQFREAHGLPIERDADPVARARLTRLIAPFVLRRTKTEVLDDLPPRTEIVRTVSLGPEEAVFYEALRRQALTELDNRAAVDQGARQMQMLAHLTRLRLACCHPQLVQDTGIQESAKLTEFMALLDELLQNRHKVLVFSQFVKHLKLIEARLTAAGISYQYLDGQTSRVQRSARIRAFQSGEGDVFLISLKAGGTGLNLTAADYVVHMDPWWNPAAEDQASDRAHRIGQTRPVTIYRLVAKGTIEEQIVALHHHKRDLAEQLLQDTDQAGTLDVEAMLALLRAPLAGI